MKILHLVKYYAPSKGGMESVVKDIVEGIVNSTNRYFFTIYTNTQIVSFKKSIIITNSISVVKELTILFFKSQPLNVRFRSLKNLLRDSDVIHHHYPYPNLEMALLRNKNLLIKKKFIITWHANIKNSRWRWLEFFYNPVIIKLLELADFIVVTSPQLLDNSNILPQFIDKVRIIPLSCDPKFNNLIPRTFPNNKEFELLFVGKLRKYKGVKFLIEAIVKLDVKLNIVGDGEEKYNLELLVNKLGIKHKVKFITNADDLTLINMYKKADLFVLPSINEAEAFGVVQLEAMANALPIINTNLKSGVPFVSINNFTGLTVEPAKVIDLELAIKFLLENPDHYNQFSKNCIERYKLFTRDRMIKSYMELYN